MSKNKWTIYLVISLLAITIVYFLFMQITNEYRNPALSQTDLVSKVEKLYNGTVQNIYKYGDNFIIEIVRDDGLYEATVNERNTHIKQLVKLSSQNETMTESTTQNFPESVEKPNMNDTSILISLNTAEQIALKQHSGEIEESEFVNTEDGGYYLIEIKNDDTEIIVQVHSVTGKVMSISYDD